jgi:hypothetical protein
MEECGRQAVSTACGNLPHAYFYFGLYLQPEEAAEMFLRNGV